MERYYWAALQTVPGLGNARLHMMVAYFGSARQAWTRSIETIGMIKRPQKDGWRLRGY